jgi:signal transduction histidine kinase
MGEMNTEQMRRMIAELSARVEELEDLKANTEQILMELDAFTYTVGHDLKNPLSAIIGLGELLQEGYDDITPDKIKQYGSAIAQSGVKMENIINQLLMLPQVRKSDDFQMEMLDMQMLFLNAYQILNSLIERSGVTITFPEEWPQAAGYEPWVAEVCVNFLRNGIEHGGRPPEIVIGADPPKGGMTRYWVRDNGPFLQLENPVEIFQPFVRRDRRREKSRGLNLCIAEAIIKKLGGEVAAQSDPETGNTFSFTLPTKL